MNTPAMKPLDEFNSYKEEAEAIHEFLSHGWKMDFQFDSWAREKFKHHIWPAVEGTPILSLYSHEKPLALLQWMLRLGMVEQKYEHEIFSYKTGDE